MTEKEPETVELTLRRDSAEQLVEYLRKPARRGAANAMPYERRDIVAGRIEDLIRPAAIGLCGLPGAGKTECAQTLSTIYEAPSVSMGGIVRRKFERRRQESGDSYNGDDLGEFAAKKRQEDPERIPSWVTEAVPDGADLVIVDGVRSPTDYDVLSDYFSEFYLIDVTCPFYERLRRLQDRGRDGEDAFDAVDLAERDERERRELGYDELVEQKEPDIHVENPSSSGPEADLLIAQNNLPYEPVVGWQEM